MRKPRKLALAAALEEWARVQASMQEMVLLVEDYRCYGDALGIIVKVNGEEPEGIRNGYGSAWEIERDLGQVVPEYVQGAVIWQEGEDEEECLL